MKLVPGPDFPTGGIILGRAGILDAFMRGRGSLKIRAKAIIEPMGKDREHIVVTEIPYQVNKSRLIENTAALINEKKIEGISDVRDESDRDGMRIVFELKRGEQADIVLNNLYKQTQLQISFGIINLSIVNGQPRELALIDTIKYFIEHRIDVVRRRTDYELRKAREREHILLGFQIALDNLDEVIRIIRAATSPKDARDSLIARFTVQREAGAGHHRNATPAPHRHGAAEDPRPNWPISRSASRNISKSSAPKPFCATVIIKELKEVQKEYGDERRTEIVDDTGEINIEDLVPVEDVAVTVTHGGYLKRTAGRYLSPPDARRQGPHRHGHAHRRLRRILPGRLNARLPADLHQQGPRLLAQDLRHPRRHHYRQGQEHFESDQPAAR